MFADVATITIRSGKGGDGHVSFHREKFVASGGPDGGDGGDGGSVYFTIDKGMNTLRDYRYKRSYKASDGQEGGKNKCHGKNGEDIFLAVPEGTLIKEALSGRVITDMSGDNRKFLALKGGHGGNGNMHYATSTMQVPRYAQPGQPAMELKVVLELKCIADVGLVGFPSVGKSTFISRVTNARPKIADYHFTTLEPNLGVVDLEGGGFVIADIPGLIKGASEGAGLGLDFLRHIERTKVLLHIVDAAGVEGRDPVEDVYAINKELEAYSDQVSNKVQIIAANKLDVCEDPDGVLKRLRNEFESGGVKVFPISAVTGEGIKELLSCLDGEVKKHRDDSPVFEQEYFPEFDRPAEEPYTVSYDEKEGVYVIEGPRIEKMLGYTNLESEKGFLFFQKFLKDNGILDELTELGINDGDTVRMYGHEFDYYK